MSSTEFSCLPLIRQVIAEFSDVDSANLTPDVELETLGIDSLTLAEMLFALEDQLGVSMAEPTERPRRVGDLMKLVEPYSDLIRAKAATA